MGETTMDKSHLNLAAEAVAEAKKRKEAQSTASPEREVTPINAGDQPSEELAVAVFTQIDADQDPQKTTAQRVSEACRFIATKYGAPIEHVYLSVQWMILSGVVPENATKWAKDFGDTMNLPGEWAGFAAALLTPTILTAISNAIDEKDQGLLKTAMAPVSTILSSPATYGAVGALLNVFATPGAAQMFLIAFTLGTAQNAQKFYNAIGDENVTTEQKGKLLYDTVANGFQALGGCVFGLDALGLGDKNPAVANDAQQWLMTTCAGGSLIGGIWETAKAVPATKTFLQEQGLFGRKPEPLPQDNENSPLLPEGHSPV